MRHLLPLIVLAAAYQQPDNGIESARAVAARKIAKQAVEEFALKSGDTPLTLEPEPLLMTANPVFGSAYGSVFLWTSKGRPMALTTAHKNYTPAKHLGVEFHSLTDATVTSERKGVEVWHPGRPGVEWKAVPGAPAVATTAAGRMRQMRAMAGQFAAAHTNESGLRRSLRLLTKPLYWYGTEASDGTLFAFTQGTDPEALLMIETRDAGAGRVEWRYAMARMTYMAVEATHLGRPAWVVPLVPWWTEPSKLRDPGEVYVEFVFHPGEGANPAADP